MSVRTHIARLAVRLLNLSPTDDYWYQPVAGPTASGVSVSYENAMSYGAVYLAVKIYAESIAQLPLHLFQQKGTRRAIADSTPLNYLVHAEPNAIQTAFEWKEQLGADLQMRGNHYSFKQYARNGRILSLTRLHPDNVTVKLDDAGEKIFEVRQKDGTKRVHRQDEILHVLGMSMDGITGLSPISYARESIGRALAARDYGSRFFANDARPSVYMKSDKVMTDEIRDKYRMEMTQMLAGGNRFKPFIADQGKSLETLSVTPEEAQFIETEGLGIDDIARFFNLPPHMLKRLERSTNNNIEHQGLEFLTYSLSPWLVRIESALNRSLLTMAEKRAGFYFKFNANALLRGDIKTRFEAYEKGRLGGWLSVNDIRALEDQDPIENGDIYLEPMNYVPAGTPRQAAAPAAAATEPEPTNYRIAFPRNGANGNGAHHES